MKCIPAVLAVLVIGCGTADAPDTAPAPEPSDTTASAPMPTGSAEWPESGPVDLRRTRAVDFTGDGVDEQIVVTARGTRYDSLDVALTIVGAQQDTLWREEWPSLIYFNYDPLEGKADSTVMRIVRGHVDDLLADEKLEMNGGLPAQLRQADPTDMMREAVRYHLAELDWRRTAGLSPAQPTPPDAHSSIRADSVAMDRVEAVVAELMERPVLMYYAGGEATYAIGWSEREQAFVRLFSCC